MSSALRRAPEPGVSDAIRLLLIDDQGSQLKLMTLLLQQAFPDCRICELQDPSGAAQLVQTQPFDCVVADYHMPQMNGLELAAQLRASQPYLPFVLCTGAGDEMLVAEAMTGGVTQYLSKTRVNAESLRRTISHAVQITSHERLIAEQQQELEHFSYALAHDFKQPIRQIKTFSQLMVAELDGDREAARRHADFLAKAADRLSRLVDVMSQYALLRQAPELVAVDVAKVMGELDEAIGGYVRERAGRLVVDVRGEVLGDETLLFQILQNLVVNGFKYNRSAQPTVHVHARVEGEACVIRVRDDGIGIAPEFHAKIFQPLTRLHGNQEYEGSGLGLALARKAAASQNGTIRCVSEPGLGSEFIVSLPAATRAARTETARRA